MKSLTQNVNLQTNKIIALMKNIEYTSIVTYGYDTYHACRDGSDCCNGDYCRCGKIINIQINDVNVDLLIDHLTQFFDKIAFSSDKILSYCVDRIIRLSKATDPKYWKVDVCRGYYGEEISGVSLDQEIKNKIIENLKSLETLSDVDKIKKCLELEYGYVLPQLQEKTQINIKQLPTNEIKLFNENYQRKLQNQATDYYENYSLPRAIVVNNGGIYSVIDGYHRVHSAIKNKLEIVEVIEIA